MMILKKERYTNNSRIVLSKKRNVSVSLHTVKFPECVAQFLPQAAAERVRGKERGRGRGREGRGREGEGRGDRGREGRKRGGGTQIQSRIPAPHCPAEEAPQRRHPRLAQAAWRRGGCPGETGNPQRVFWCARPADTQRPTRPGRSPPPNQNPSGTLRPPLGISASGLRTMAIFINIRDFRR